MPDLHKPLSQLADGIALARTALQALESLELTGTSDATVTLRTALERLDAGYNAVDTCA